MDRTGGTTAALDADLYPSGLHRPDVPEPLRGVWGRAMSQTASNGPSRKPDGAVDKPRRCDAEYPGTQNLTCLKPAGHDDRHATCLGYHPEPYDEWEWAEWEATS